MLKLMIRKKYDSWYGDFMILETEKLRCNNTKYNINKYINIYYILKEKYKEWINYE